jgi:hypothetical protein
LVVVYRDRQDDEVRDIAILRYVKGNWTKPMPVHVDNWRIAGCPVNGPSLDAYEHTVGAAWFTMEAGDSARVYAAFSSDRGEEFGTPMRVDLGSALGRVDLCMLDRNRACVVWLQTVGKDTKIFMRVITDSGTMSSPISVGQTSADRESGFPRIAFDGDNVIVVWTDPTGGPKLRAAQLVLD